jgi:mono/diheme cytochrome c family protein
MFKRLGQMIVSALLIATTTLLVGCGEEKEDNVPASKLTASTVASDPAADGHVHSVVIPFTDISATPSVTSQYRSGDTSGHSHVIALSTNQMADLSNGMRVTLTSSSQNTHSHIWNILGGVVLYDKNCYNCHTNDKRGHSPMNVSFNASQTNAVRSPATAPASPSTPAVPDPSYMPSTTVSLDGVALYASNCSASSCHGPLASSSKANRTATQIKSAITGNAGGMASLGGLTDAQLQAIATALVK